MQECSSLDTTIKPVYLRPKWSFSTRMMLTSVSPRLSPVTRRPASVMRETTMSDDLLWQRSSLYVKDIPGAFPRYGPFVTQPLFETELWETENLKWPANYVITVNPSTRPAVTRLAQPPERPSSAPHPARLPFQVSATRYVHPEKRQGLQPIPPAARSPSGGSPSPAPRPQTRTTCTRSPVSEISKH
eukprot:TRINITY_DN2493_c0_g2_i1.p1 TRINITY_DN2493_c0_g2~~TRINITY_DN2493_c0_g2_i1.p1  ORF type:complete len:187 (-),score=14.71 TRINITY_DN2493_c0_g2_i1:175-735(-)